ncbi:acyltransferase 3 [Paraphysoderma sedebokerense]|nr:acyltransferase 3 [Paraphysoderma sedebokerense]
MLRTEKLLYLEGIRGSAAFVVAIYHYVTAVGTAMLWGAQKPLKSHYPDAERILPSTPLSFLWAGSLSVSIFFVLSGRCIVLNYYKSRRIEKLTSSAIRRPLRLALPLWGSYIILLLMIRVNAFNQLTQWRNITSSVWLKSPNDDIYTVKDFIGKCARLISDIVDSPEDSGELGPLYPSGAVWTIPIELKASFWVYLAALVATDLNTPARYLFYTVITVSSWWQLSWNSIFFLGLMFCDLSVSGEFAQLQKARKSILWSLRIALFALFYLPQIPPVMRWMKRIFLPFLFNGKTIGLDQELMFYESPTEFNLPAAAFLLLIEITPSLRSIFSISPLVFLGKISYGLYLMHGLVLFSIVPSVFIPIYEYHQLSYIAASMICAFIYIIFAVICGWLFWWTVDYPSLRFARWFELAIFREEWSHEKVKKWFRKLWFVRIGMLIYQVGLRNAVRQGFVKSKLWLRSERKNRNTQQNESMPIV